MMGKVHANPIGPSFTACPTLLAVDFALFMIVASSSHVRSIVTVMEVHWK